MQAVTRARLATLGRWLPVLAYASLIAYLSSQAGGGTPRWELLRWLGRHDKVAHTIEYSGLGLLLVRALAGGPREGGWLRHLGLAFLIGTGFGVSDELHQSFVPGREGNDPGDVMADAGGTLLGGLVFAGWQRRLREGINRQRHAGRNTLDEEAR
jgi:VanZ like family